MKRLSDYKEIWSVDFEFSTDTNLLPQPICMVAVELHSGKELRVWLAEDPPKEIPFNVGEDALYVAYYASAEVSCHLALGWKLPTHVLDLYVEYRNMTNGRKLPLSRGLIGALTYFGLDSIAAIEKKEMRDLAIRGGPFTESEAAALMDYCASDVHALVKLLPKMESHINLGQALLRGRYISAVAQMERNGIPIDLDLLQNLKENWEEIKLKLVAEVDKDFNVYEGTTFKMDKWQQYLHKHNIPWSVTDNGNLKLDDDTFKDACRIYPQLRPLRDLRYILGQLKLNSLAVGEDGRNRCLLSPFQSRTGRNQPSNAKFIFGPAVWLRGLIKPEKGKAIAYVDWSQQEFGIAAALSGDDKMKAAYESGDPYLEFAKQAAAVPPDATKKSHKKEREQYKACVLATQYSMGAESLAFRINDNVLKAQRLLLKHRETYRDFWKWSDAAVNHAILYGQIQTVFGWQLHVDSGYNIRSLQNFPMQSNGAEMLRLGVILALERGVKVLAPIHDAILVEGDADNIEEVVRITQQALVDASKIILKGFELRSDADVVIYPERYMDERGVETFNTVNEIIYGKGDAVNERLEHGRVGDNGAIVGGIAAETSNEASSKDSGFATSNDEESETIERKSSSLHRSDGRFRLVNKQFGY